MIHTPFCRRARGFSIVELMVSLTIGMVLLGGTMTVFIGNRNSHRYQQAISQLQDNARFGMEFMARTMRLAGYQGSTPGQWVLGALTPTVGGGVAVQGTNNDATVGNGILDGTDTVTVSNQGSDDGLIKDCQGNTVAAGALVSNYFSVSEAGLLQCSIDGGATWVSLADDVQDMQIQYGLDANGDLSANRYVTAPNVTNFQNVVSVRVAMLMASGTGNLNLGVDGNAYTLLDKVVYAAGLAPADGRVRRVVSGTIKLRNR